MRSYLIIDSNKIFAERLYTSLTGEKLSENNNYWDVSTRSKLELGKLSDGINQKISDEQIILINAEAKIKDGYYQNQDLIELAFWLRSKHKIKNQIIFYSFRSINQLLKINPENFILLSPGCFHLKFPFSKQEIEKISSTKKLENLNLIKPFLKQSINLERIRHTYANFAAMNLMVQIAKQVYGKTDDNQIINNESKKFNEFYKFRKSLDYYRLATYFDLEKTISIDEKAKDNLKVDKKLLSKKILLVDDLAFKGWENILKQVIYGNIENNDLISLTLEENLLVALESQIKKHKPDLILLDLRLNGEEKEKEIENLEGFNLLKYIKSHNEFKGVPVIMFTASSNAETIKKLFEVGAEAVWTKPGIDEGLKTQEIIKRYSDLIKYITELLNKFSNLKYYSQKVTQCNFSDLRIQLLQKIEWVKYRLKLNESEYDKIIQKSAFNKFTDIYFDTNFLMTSHTNTDVIESLCNLYILSVITTKTKKSYDYDGHRHTYIEPKVVIINQVLDELMKKIKTGEDPINNLVYIILKDLLNGNIRTEYENYNSHPNFEPQFKLNNPKENHYADPFIIDDISHLIVLGFKKFKYRIADKVKEKQVYFPNRKALLITDDGDLIRKTSNMFKSGFNRFSISEFNQEVSKIIL